MRRFVARLTGPLVKPFAEFFQTESSSGLVLLGASVLALVLANTDVGVARYFPAIWERMLGVTAPPFALVKTLSHWINDGLMALFFLVVGLEIKREVLEGELSSWRQALLPLAGALGGMLLPALLYVLLNAQTPTAHGWGIPMATDIAFALAVLYLLGDRVPLALKVFLTALAIADDLGAVTVVAIFYTKTIALNYLLAALGLWAGLLLLNALGVRKLRVYLVLGVVLWYWMLKSGVHATIAGVLLAMAIPSRISFTADQLTGLVRARLALMQDALDRHDVQPRDISEELEAMHAQVSSPAQRLEEGLHGLVSYGIVPLFAFCNTSVVIDTAVLGQLGSPLALGIVAGLLLGKPLGIMACVWLAVRTGVATLPVGVTWRHLLGASLLAGIGFTMSIFITLLAFEGQPDQQNVAKVAILLASLVAGGLGYALLRRTST